MPRSWSSIIRRAIEWGGAVVMVLLVVVWIGGGWWNVRYKTWPGPSETEVGIGEGCVSVAHAQGYAIPETPEDAPGFSMFPVGEHAPRLRLWFYGRQGARTFVGSMPVWVFLVAAFVATGIAWRADRLARRLARLKLCPKCGYDRAGLVGDAICPECGAAPRVG